MTSDLPSSESRNKHPSSLHDLMAATTVKSPDAVAICAPGRPPLSYRRLLDHLHMVHQELHRLGVRRNDRVALVVPDGPEIAVAFVTVAASATCAPLNPAYRASEYEFYLSHLKVSALLVQSDLDSPARMVAHQRGIPVIDLTPNREVEAGLFALTGVREGDVTDAGFAAIDDVALLLHTSGTTAQPKRVSVTHHNLCIIAQNYATAMTLTPRDRCLNMMPLYHGVGLQTALATIAAGGSVVCPPRYDIDAFFTWLEEFRPSWYSATPPTYHAILSRAQEHRAAIDRFPLRFIRAGADALSPKMREELEQTFGAPVIETYGMTETSLICCSPLPPRPRKAGSVGVAVGPEVAIMDEAGTLVPPGVAGEIVVRGPTVVTGYEDDPEANAAAFRHGWFRTGDLGLLDADGYLFLRGRLKDLINRGGTKIVPREVEDALAAHPAVAEAVAFPLPHRALGEDVAAAVVLQHRAQATESDLRRWVADGLADFKVPCRVLIVDELPKAPTGKLLRRDLCAQFGPLLETQFVPPRTSMEKELARIWVDVLDVERVGIHDNFFELGGTSLTSVRMFTQMQQVTGRNLPRTTLLRAPTIKQLVDVLDRAEAEMQWPSLVAIQPKGSRPPFFCMHPLTGNVLYLRDLARHLGPDQPFFALQPQGLDGRTGLHTRIEDMAAHYVKEIRAFLPEGPYFLGGHSFGGLIAYEVAQQLAAQGQRVALLALIDTFFPTGRDASAPVTHHIPGATFLLDRIRFHLENLLELKPRDALTYVIERLESVGGKLSRALARARSPLHRGMRQQPSHDPSPSALALLGADYPLFHMIRENNLRAGRVYVPCGYPGRVTIFLGEAPQALGWLRSRRMPARLAAGGAEIYKIPGGHATILLEPRVRILAEKLRASIDRAIASAHDPGSALVAAGAIPAPSS
jgi:oxalate---CoA ligase